MLLKKSGNFISLLFYPVLFVNRVVVFHMMWVMDLIMRFLCSSERFFLYFNEVSECFGGNSRFDTWIAMMLNDAD